DLKYEMTHEVIGKNSAVVEYSSSGTLENNEKGVPAYMRGKKYVLKNCTRMDFENGKIVSEATYFDQVSFLKQMGYFEQKK
ncbi:MAG: ester cyclase, partial [Bacteroidota bacterium]|nr:ester cyclase [Bacteroidota bacterium]